MMNGLISKMIDIEEALAQFYDMDLYRASIDLFKAMNYPVIPSYIAVNSSIKHFFCFAAENYPNFYDDELVSINFIDSISYLFSISSENPGLDYIKNVTFNSRCIDKIIFLAVEITGFKNSRSFDAFDLTIILSKVFSSPVFILFKHENELMFSARSIVLDKKQTEKIKVYLSDWYNYNILSTDELIKLSALSFEYQDDTNFLSMYYDMITSISRKYYINFESYDFLRYGLTFDELKYKFALNKEDYQSFFGKINDLKQRRNYYKNLYGYDYIDAEIEIDISFEDEERMLEELETLLLTETDLETIEFDGNDLSAKSNRGESLEDEEFTDQIDQIETSLFKDPIKLLKYLNEFSP